MADHRSISGDVPVGISLPPALQALTGQLIHGLQQLPAYQQRTALYTAVMADAGMRSLYHTYTQQKEALQLQQAAGYEPTAEETNALAAFNHLMGQYPTLQELVLVEAELEGLVGQVLGNVMRQVLWTVPEAQGKEE